MRTPTALFVAAGVMTACTPAAELEPPGPRDTGALVVDVVNRSEAPVDIVHNGRSGSGSGRIDQVAARCEAIGFGVPQDEGWQLLINGEEVLDGGIVRGPDGAPLDVRATVEIAPNGSVSVSDLEPWSGPPETRRPVPGCPST